MKQYRRRKNNPNQKENRPRWHKHRKSIRKIRVLKQLRQKGDNIENDENEQSETKTTNKNRYALQEKEDQSTNNRPEEKKTKI